MKNILLTAAALFTFLLVAPVHAQLTGPSVLSFIGDSFARQSGYSIVSGTNTVLVKDVESGRTLFVVKDVNQQTITLSSVVASLRQLSPESRDRMLKQISQYNFSSAVGTLWYDNATGEVTMEHHLNPRLVSSANIVSVANRFGDAVRAEKTVLAQ